jgi:hypothetical protein
MIAGPYRGNYRARDQPARRGRARVASRTLHPGEEPLKARIKRTAGNATISVRGGAQVEEPEESQVALVL